MSYIVLDALIKEHGKAMAGELFEAFRNSKPTTVISPDFAMQIIEELSDLYVKIDRIDWGLESEDASYALEWCEQYHLSIPEFGAKIMVEVGDNHYYVHFESGYGDSNDETFRHWEDIPDFISQCVQVFHGQLFARLIFDQSQEFPFGLITYTDPFCMEDVDTFWHGTAEDRCSSIGAWEYVVVNPSV